MSYSIGTTAPASVDDTTGKMVYKGSVETIDFGQANALKNAEKPGRGSSMCGIFCPE